MVKIFIDPGHGGSDPGATGNGLQEKTLTLQIALALRTILINEYEGVSLLLSRTSDQYVSLSDRTNAANSWGADFFLSIHINAGGGTGFESYIYPGVGAPTTTYQSAIHSNVIQAVDFADRGRKTANFHVLRESAMPALLTENGFIDTVADANKLKTNSFIQSLARGYANGLEQAFNLKKTSSSRLYKVQVGAFKVKENADSLASSAEAKGFDTIVLLKDGLYKVQIGAFSSKDNADALAARARNAGFDAIVILES
ncbi:N-acetylmuramoyl-L-alanine amidase [Bacillus spizizenii ATCC 6633 = JCM 2499]|uniref:N-acetylmuramoyl-L-alanine amidase n=1 Tax=Bacillus spizizenii (strain ATCC 23059 / NRRL B-14472 / W23) TaxID=655816 RepID=E0TVR1_BACSH|nr:N-acetylmuramoyl-L-alanine amidase [Bacillus spizizenii]QCJ17047.1 N-acetylmuramoyl-L-alanine amidase [Bacillus subtilis]ADM37837.1 N-acetylmuramoyl-L-alanine amidase [Bacillus spizizenii str. W23]AJW87190.1 N-acetylmuramoyl-L-alanine amidase [Bacillus spizizenii]EFG92835.1 N-acetylmuramoyl-L-alanine amidase [Bacillus spizizenii ATCC 6633 = JCM 2499]KFK80472.1 sporulation-specific N-acetylmuramoyl-L-alanine amidase [Bacillus spizizenii]